MVNTDKGENSVTVENAFEIRLTTPRVKDMIRAKSKLIRGNQILNGSLVLHLER